MISLGVSNIAIDVIVKAQGKQAAVRAVHDTFLAEPKPAARVGRGPKWNETHSTPWRSRPWRDCEAQELTDHTVSVEAIRVGVIGCASPFDGGTMMVRRRLLTGLLAFVALPSATFSAAADPLTVGAGAGGSVPCPDEALDFFCEVWIGAGASVEFSCIEACNATAYGINSAYWTPPPNERSWLMLCEAVVLWFNGPVPMISHSPAPECPLGWQPLEGWPTLELVPVPDASAVTYPVVRIVTGLCPASYTYALWPWHPYTESHVVPCAYPDGVGFPVE